MKKIIFCLFTIVLLFSLVACGEGRMDNSTSLKEQFISSSQTLTSSSEELNSSDCSGGINSSDSEILSNNSNITSNSVSSEEDSESTFLQSSLDSVSSQQQSNGSDNSQESVEVSSSEDTSSESQMSSSTTSSSVTESEYNIFVEQSDGGTVTASKTTANYGDIITLSNTPTAGYVFSTYVVKTGSTNLTVTDSAFTMPAGNVTVTASFVSGIDGLSNFNYTATANYASSYSGSIAVSGNSVTSSQMYYPSATGLVDGNFYFETEIALDKAKIYNDELYCKAGIVISDGDDIIYAPIDALTNGWDNGGFGNNTWLVYAMGRGTLGGGIDWSFWGSTDHCGNFNKNYSSNTTYIKLGVLRVGGVYKFFANDKFMYSSWQPNATGTVQVGILSINIGFTAKNTKVGYGSTVINNVNAYYGLTSTLHPTSRTIDGKVDGRTVNDSNAVVDYSWKENLVTTYGAEDGTRYFHASSFKGSNGIYVAVKARTINYITTATNVWENTNVELRATGGSNAQVRIFFAADGTVGMADSDGNILSSTGFSQAWTYYQDTDGYYVITMEGLIPYSALGISNSSSAVTIQFAFRSEEVGYNMTLGQDGVWWCGMSWDNVTVNTTGLGLIKETTPTEKNIKPGVSGADPFVMPYNNKYYLYATTGTSTGYKVYVSDDLNTWRLPTTQDFADVGVTEPYTEMLSGGWCFHKNWSNSVYYNKSETAVTVKSLWAPEVVYNSSTKKFVMTYSGYRDVNNDSVRAYDENGKSYWTNTGDDLAVVSVATSDSPLGPFIDVYSGEPGFLAPAGDTAKASIDASIFVDTDGTAYLYYCNDCTRNGIENFKGTGDYWGISEVWVVKLDSTWTATTGTHTKCITPYQDWETQNDADSPNTAWNEGPYVYKHNGTYYMTYSANPYWNAMYGVGLAFAKSPTGPWYKYNANPIVVKIPGKTAGTGHNMFFKDFDGKLWCAYHTYSDPNDSGNIPRELLLSRAWFDNGILKVESDNW